MTQPIILEILDETIVVEISDGSEFDVPSMSGIDWYGLGSPNATVVEGAQPGQVYLDLESGNVYKLE